MKSIAKRKLACAVAGILALPAYDARGTIPAFSGAEGPGANATGGRGGDVYHVTKLDFDLNGTTAGTLKYGINNAPAEGRTIVFDVGGTIYHNGGGSQWWFRSGKSNITIAGQTAPGGGITFAGVGTKWTGDNVILRNITSRPNKDAVNPSGATYDAISTQLTNSIIDHVSATWYSDEGISQTDAGYNTTIQYSLIAEGLNYNGHSYGSIINTQVDTANLSYHHNLYASNASRMPRLGSELPMVGSETFSGAITNFANNTVYNWTSRAGYSALNTDTGLQEPSSTNFQNNFYIVGPSNGSTIFLSAGDRTKIYQNGRNKQDTNKDGDLNDGVLLTWSDFTGSETQMSVSFSVAQGVLDTADVALQRDLDYTGANWTNRNSIETRIINGVKNGTNAIINDLTGATQAAEWSTILSQQADVNGNAPFTRPAGWDTDGDGMPDAWEIARGLNPNSPINNGDNNGDDDTDGYTNLEEYINDIAAFPAPTPISWAGGNGRYALINNWDIKWQPSKYDTVQVNTGTATVDAMGQTAGTISVGNGGTLAITGGRLDVANKITVLGRLNWTGGKFVPSTTSDLVVGTGTVPSAVTLSAGRDKTLRVRNITVNTEAKLDLNDNAMVVSAGSLNSIKTLILAGHAKGTWTGPGITSSSAASVAADNSNLHKTALGYATASSIGVTTFNGQAVDPASVLILYTYKGDANLDSTVNLLDLNALVTNYGGAGGKVWSQADMNYDGFVNALDFNAIAANYGFGLPAPTAAMLPGALVPEPASFGLLIGSAFLLCGRVRRRAIRKHLI